MKSELQIETESGVAPVRDDQSTSGQFRSPTKMVLWLVKDDMAFATSEARCAGGMYRYMPGLFWEKQAVQLQ